MAIDLRTNYGGLTLCSPIVVGACPLTAQESTRIALANAGAGALVLPSLHQEEVVEWQMIRRHRGNCASNPSPVNENSTECESAIIDADEYLQLVSRAATGSPIPIIASLNGTSANQWIQFATRLESAGASAIELNIHRGSTGRYHSPREIEDAIVESVKLINQSVKIPTIVKVGREFTSVGHLATRLQSGADAMVLHGRSPDIDICLDNFETCTRWGLSATNQLGQTLSTMIRVHEHCPAMPLAACGGISSSTDVVKVLLAGADVAMVVSAMYREGPDVVRQMIDGLRMFMEQKHFTNLNAMKEMRPIASTSGKQREEYKASLSEQPACKTNCSPAPTATGDRFGHVD